MSLRPVVTAAFGSLLGAGLAGADPIFEAMPGPDAFAVSEDGCVVVGQAENRAVRWENGVSTPLFEDPGNYSTANGISADGEVVVGLANGSRAFRLDDLGTALLSLPAGTPHEARAVSADGTSVGGCVHALVNGQGCDWPFYWRDGVGELLPDLTGNFSFGSVRALSSDGRIAAGTASTASGTGAAVLWRPAEDGIQELAKLPGHVASAVLGLSPDGAFAVGSSFPPQYGQPHAVRWDAAGIHDLGAATRFARGTSADGKRIVGVGEFDGVWQAFLWDAPHGARPLADVLRDDYGVDIGEFELSSANAISPDGKTIVGTGTQAWRVRLREDACVPRSGITWLTADPDMDPPLGRIEAIASDAPERVYLAAGYGHFLRFDVAPDGSAGSPAEIPDLFDGSNPMVLRPGPDGVYAGGGGHPRVWHVDPDGSARLVFDASTWPALAPPNDQMPTWPADFAVAPDGTLFVAAYARLVRIEPDGSARELIDAPRADAALGLGHAGIWHVAGGANGRLFLLFENEGVVTVDAETGAVLAARRDLPTPRALAADPDGGFWLYGDGLAHYTANGVRKTFFEGGQVPDGAGGTGYGPEQLVVDELGDVYYHGWTVDDAHPFVAQLTTEGVSQQILGWGTPTGFYRWFIVEAMHTSHRTLYFAENGRLGRYALPPIPVCANGLDDDGDGAADFPADKGCLFRDDGGERSFEQPCDDGIDNDHDGVADFPADPGCVSLTGPYEKTECDDGLDNDGDGAADWDGAGLGAADPECAGDPRAVIEHLWYCGLGFEVAIVVLPLTQAARRWRRRRMRPTGDGGGAPAL